MSELLPTSYFFIQMIKLMIKREVVDAKHMNTTDDPFDLNFDNYQNNVLIKINLINQSRLKRLIKKMVENLVVRKEI